MKILYITNKPVYPKNDGGCVAMANFLQNLIFQDCSVIHIAISTNKHPFDLKNYPLEIQEKVNCSSVNMNTSINPLNALKSLFRKSSYNIDRFYSEELFEKIEEEIKEDKFDCVILDSLYSTAHLKEIRSIFKGRIFIRTHNVECDIWSDLAANERNFAKRIVLKKLAKNLKQIEISTLNKADGIISITEDDASKMRKYGVKTNVLITPVTIPLSKKTNNYSSSSVFHLGAMNWKPNEEAVRRLIKLFSKIHDSQPETQLRLAGSHFPKDITSSQDIIIDGFVEDIFDYSIECGILVTPITSGSGVRIKILEMMSVGTPIITTQKGAAGIHCKNCLIIVETDEEIINTTIELIKNKQKRMEIGQNSRSYIQNNHSIEKISQQLIEFIQTK